LWALSISRLKLMCLIGVIKSRRIIWKSNVEHTGKMRNTYSILHLIFVLLSINVTFTFYFLLIVDMFRPQTSIFRCYSILSRSWCSVMPIFLPLSGCQPCAPADGVLIVSALVLEYLCCLCGRHVACLLQYITLYYNT
jgi:hypothetical protein